MASALLASQEQRRYQPMRPSRLVLAFAVLAAACANDDSRTRRIAAYDTLDSCAAYKDEDTCLANADR